MAYKLNYQILSIIGRKCSLFLYRYYFVLLFIVVFCFYKSDRSRFSQRVDYLYIPWEERQDRKIVRYFDTFEPPVPEDDEGSPKIKWSPEKLRELLQIPTKKCKKLVAVGGTYSCPTCEACFKDGHKYVCLDDDVRPRPGNCTVYSFGVGENTSFDEAMARFKCKVFAFDMSIENRTNQILEPDLHLLTIGLWPEDVEVEFTLINKEESEVTKKSSPMRSLRSIMEILDDNDKIVDFLKMDVEFSEWSVFESIFKAKDKPSILQQISQIAIEIHLDDFKNVSRADRDIGGQRYENVLGRLHQENFHLVNTELNTYLQLTQRVRGYKFPVFRESLYIRRQ